MEDEQEAAVPQVEEESKHLAAVARAEEDEAEAEASRMAGKPTHPAAVVWAEEDEAGAGEPGLRPEAA